MGDFEDTFGAGADIVSIIDRYGREDRPYEPAPPEPYKRWFADYPAAAAWEASHKGISFVRRRNLGGFEIETFDIPSQGESAHRTTAEPYPTAFVPAPDLKDVGGAHGKFALTLADTTDTALVRLLDHMRKFLPEGRFDTYPIRLTKKEFYAFFKTMPDFFSHDIELGRGAMIVLGDDHSALIGRRHGEHEMRIEPWIFDINCAGGHGSASSTHDQSCFLCSHKDIELVRGGSLEDWDVFNRYDLPHRFIPGTAYSSGARADLASCVLDWLDALVEIDATLGPDRSPPSCVSFEFADNKSIEQGIRDLCQVLACALAAKADFDWSRNVSVDIERAFWSQTRGPRMKMSHGKVTEYHLIRNKIPVSSIPPIAAFDPSILEDLATSVLMPCRREMGRSNTKPWSVSGIFRLGEPSAHYKIQAFRLLGQVEKTPLPEPLAIALQGDA